MLTYIEIKCLIPLPKYIKPPSSSKQSDHTKYSEREPWREARLFSFKKSCLVKICDRGREEKDGDVQPIGGGAYHSVVGVEQHGNKSKTQEDPPQLHAPKILAVAEEKALHHGVEKQRPKQELHMLPGGFVYPGEQGTEFAVEPFVQKV